MSLVWEGRQTKSRRMSCMPVLLPSGSVLVFACRAFPMKKNSASVTCLSLCSPFLCIILCISVKYVSWRKGPSVWRENEMVWKPLLLPGEEKAAGSTSALELRLAWRSRAGGEYKRILRKKAVRIQKEIQLSTVSPSLLTRSTWEELRRVLIFCCLSQVTSEACHAP